MDLEGKVALVTGGARRVGRAIAAALARARMHVAIHHHASPDQARETARELERDGVHTAVFQADLTDFPQLVGLFEAHEAEFGRLDVLVNNAAIFERKPVAEIAPEDWSRTIDLNLRAPFFCSQHAARSMAETGGRIVNIADVAAFEAWPGYAHYCISKAGLIMMTRVLARALAPRIHVNAVAPGPVLPPEALTDSEREAIADATVLRRLGSPDDVADAVIFLARSNYITGETIVVDGGKRLR
jgi:NAD(P)-dependent dehydrogenase (short-subunit alcohol dehydrogenase family)